MCRILAGTIAEVGMGKYSAGDMPDNRVPRPATKVTNRPTGRVNSLRGRVSGDLERSQIWRDIGLLEFSA